VVLNLVGGSEPHKFHSCIHRTLRSWKNKMCVVNFIFFYFYCSKSLASKPLGFDRIQVKNHCSTHMQMNSFLNLFKLHQVWNIITDFQFILHGIETHWCQTNRKNNSQSKSGLIYSIRFRILFICV